MTRTALGISMACLALISLTGCGASSLSRGGMEQQLVSRGFASADCQHSASVKRRYAWGVERTERMITWCRVAYTPHGTSWPYPARVVRGVVLPVRGCRANRAWIVPPGSGNTLRGVHAVCRERQGIGWYITTREGSTRYASSPFPYTEPISILGVYRFAPHVAPAILAQVGWGMTGQPYELFTFSRHRVVPARMTFLHANGAYRGLAGGGAAFHGQGVLCSAKRHHLVITQVWWSGPSASAPVVRHKDGGQTPAATDAVTATYERWTFTGQPLRQRSVAILPPQVVTYRAANALENAHC
jgi:hypothetical protein